MDVIDGDVLPDETPVDVLARLERQALAVVEPHGLIEVDAGAGGLVSTPVTHAEYGALAADQLYIGFYNKSGDAPERSEFDGSAGKMFDGQELPRRRPGPKLLPAVAGQPFQVVERCGLAPLHPLRSYRDNDKSGVYSARARIVATSYVTHVVVGTRASGIITALELATPIPVLAGAHLQFALRLGLYGALSSPPAPKALPPNDTAV